jgi:AbrB family looped-hinge helix DNA binding protein
MSDRIIQISKITSNRQVTIPVDVMDKLKVKRGDKIIWIERNGDIIVRKAELESRKRGF